MYLTKMLHIKINNPAYHELDHLMFLSKNLYNTCLYLERQCYFNKRDKVKEGIVDDSPWYIKERDLAKLLCKENQLDYRALPAAVAQQVCFQVGREFKAFFEQKKKNLKANLPKYKDKVTGRNVIKYALNGLSLKALKKKKIRLTKFDFDFSLPEYIDQSRVQEIYISYTKNHEMRMYIIYKVDDCPIKKNNGRYASIDLGVTNLATVVSNTSDVKPFIINGRPLKSINQQYNKRKAYLQQKLSQEKGEHYVSKLMRNLGIKREHRVSDYMHKSSKMLVNHLVSNNINTLVIGYTKEWKQEINIGRANNQSFVNIPHLKFVQMLQYKSALQGINCVITDEEHTSVCSFFDGEELRQSDSHLGKRIKRGLYRTAAKRLVNADVNAALNILKHAIPDVRFSHHGIEGYANPIRFTVS